MNLSFLKNKSVKWTLFAVIAIFVVWITWTYIKRSKDRKNLTSYLIALPATDPWKSTIIEKATANAVTIEQQCAADAEYLNPVNPFKSKPANTSA
jgi:hypothetical protein